MQWSRRAWKVFWTSGTWHFCGAQRYGSSFCKTADAHLHGHYLCLEDRICNGADASSEKTLGRTPALLAEGHRVPGQDVTTLGSTWNLVLWLQWPNQKVAALLQTMISDAPGRLPELDCRSCSVAGVHFALYKDDKGKQGLKSKCTQPFPSPEKRNAVFPYFDFVYIPRWYGLNVCVPSSQYWSVEILMLNVMVLGGGAFGRWFSQLPLWWMRLMLL